MKKKGVSGFPEENDDPKNRETACEWILAWQTGGR